MAESGRSEPPTSGGAVTVDYLTRLYLGRRAE